MPTKTWAVGEEALAADMNTYVQQQVVPTFPNAAARDTAMPAPLEGQLSVLLDSVALSIRRGGAWTSVPPAYATAAALQAALPNALIGSRALCTDTFRPYTKRAAGGAGWQPDYQAGVAALTTNASGFPPVVAHDLGRAPVAVLITAQDSGANLYGVTIMAANNFQPLVRVSSTGGPAVSLAVRFSWVAF